VRDELVLGAMRKVRASCSCRRTPRIRYEDLPLPIAGGKPFAAYIVAFMAESLLLKGGEKILEIGGGLRLRRAVAVGDRCEV